MITINEHYFKLKASYLFSDIAKRMTAFQDAHPDREIIKLGIGDVTSPLPATCIQALHTATDEMGAQETFRGYGPEQGYDFLREAIVENDYNTQGCSIAADEVFISDGSKCDAGNIQELFSNDITVAVSDPVYPVYVDTNVMAGRTGNCIDGRYKNLVYLECNKENNFVPALPSQKVDLIYLCFPNNPTGATASRKQLEEWVEYARANKALILYDAAYEAFIRDEDIPKSIYEIEGAKDVAIEFRSFSKNAGFTGTRCAFTVIPKSCVAYDKAGTPHNLHALWNRRHCTKFNGVSYPVQRAAESVYSEQGKIEVRALTDYYMENARIIHKRMTDLGFKVTGGDNSPYIWINTGMDSWEFFDMLMEKTSVVTTPGSGFGSCGKGYIRISAFNDRKKVIEAMSRMTTELMHL